MGPDGGVRPANGLTSLLVRAPYFFCFALAGLSVGPTDVCAAFVAWTHARLRVELVVCIVGTRATGDSTSAEASKCENIGPKLCALPDWRADNPRRA